MFRFQKDPGILIAAISIALLSCTGCSSKSTPSTLAVQVVDGLPSSQYLDRVTEDIWAGYYLFDKKAGHVHFDARKDGDVYRASSVARLKIRGLGDTREISVDEIREYHVNDGRLVRVDMRFVGLENRHILLEEGPDSYTLTERIGDETKVTELPSPGETLKGMLSPQIRIWEGDVKPGTTFEKVSFRVVPPLHAKATRTRYEFLEPEIRFVQGVLTKFHIIKQVEEEFGLEITSVYTEEGRLVRMDQGGGISVRVEPQAVATSAVEAPDVLSLTLVRVDPPIQDVSTLDSIDLRITMPKLPASFDSGRVRVLQREGKTATIRITRTAKAPSEGVELSTTEGLEASSLIQSDAPEIRRLAKILVADAKTPEEMVDRLIQGVHRTVKKAYRPELASALDVVRTMEGDCTEHAVLFVALARSLRIPSRALIGLTHTSMMGGGFGGHAWAEVWIDGQWQAVDPAFGQRRADVGHIPFNVGEIDLRSMLALSASLGEIEIDVVQQTEAK